MTWLEKNVKEDAWSTMVTHAMKSSFPGRDEPQSVTNVGTAKQSYSLLFKDDETGGLPDGQIRIIVIVDKPKDRREAAVDVFEHPVSLEPSTGASAAHEGYDSSVWSNMAPGATGTSGPEPSGSEVDTWSIQGTDMGKEPAAPFIPRVELPGFDLGFSQWGSDLGGDTAAAIKTLPRQDRADQDTTSLVPSAGEKGDAASESEYAPYFEDPDGNNFGATYVPGSGSQLGLSSSGLLSDQRPGDGSALYPQSDDPDKYSGYQASSAALGAPGPSGQQLSSMEPEQSYDRKSDVSSLSPSEEAKRFSTGHQMRVSLDD